jgi:hypothetical protein
LHSTGWLAGGSTDAVLHSDPVALGSLTANTSGVIAGQLTVPLGTPAGAHTIELTGTAANGTARTVTVALTIQPDQGTPTTGGAAAPSVVSRSGLARTGDESLRLLWSGTSFVGAGALCAIAAKRRQAAMRS